MVLLVPIQFADGDKLQILRHLDRYRTWRSLDEKRYCLACGKIITGWQIQLAGGTRGNGPLRLSCPTERCNSIPMDWVLPTDEMLAKAETMAAEEPNTSASSLADSGEAGHSMASRLRKFAVHFKRELRRA